MSGRPGWIEAAYDVTIEIEDRKRPALTARWLTLMRLEQPEEPA